MCVCGGGGTYNRLEYGFELWLTRGFYILRLHICHYKTTIIRVGGAHHEQILKLTCTVSTLSLMKYLKRAFLHVPGKSDQPT